MVKLKKAIDDSGMTMTAIAKKRRNSKRNIV